MLSVSPIQSEPRVQTHILGLQHLFLLPHQHSFPKVASVFPLLILLEHLEHHQQLHLFQQMCLQESLPSVFLLNLSTSFSLKHHRVQLLWLVLKRVYYLESSLWLSLLPYCTLPQNGMTAIRWLAINILDTSWMLWLLMRYQFNRLSALEPTQPMLHLQQLILKWQHLPSFQHSSQ
jgi:hypothetical protein